MQFQTALLGVLIVATVAILASLGGRPREKEPSGPVRDFFHSNGLVSSWGLLQLLLSSSFSLNAVFYALWLGYFIGGWAILVQIAWGLGYVLVMPFVGHILTSDGLHPFIRRGLGASASRIAALCSLIGMAFMIGWEFDIGRATLFGLLNAEASPMVGQKASTVLAVLLLVSGVIYSASAGLRGNIRADGVLNSFKIVGIIWLCGMLLPRAIGASVRFPDLIERLGWIGLITTLLFNLSWQFIDSSSWMSIIGARDRDVRAVRHDLALSGLATIVIPGILGALIGMGLSAEQGVTQSNIFIRATQFSLGSAGMGSFLTVAVISACTLSLLDGLFLATAGIVAVDIPSGGDSTPRLDATGIGAERLLLLSRVALVIVALGAVVALEAYKMLAQERLFDFVYVVIVPQLALLGPVLSGLLRRSARFAGAGVAILLLSAFAGFVSAWAGREPSSQWLLEAAGSISAVTSVVLSFALTKNSRTESR